MTGSRDAAVEIHSPATYAALVGMCLIWGSTFLAIRIGNESVPPLWGATIRLALASILCGLLMRFTGATWPRGEALGAVLWFGVLNFGLNFVLLYWGEQTVPSGTAAVFYATIPLTTGIFAAVLRVHALDRVQLAAALIGFGGVALIFWGELQVGAPAVALLAVFLAATLASLSGVILKKGPPQSTWVVNTLGAAVGSGICLAGSLLLGERRAVPGGLPGWGPILYLVVAGNLGAYALYGWLITKWRVTRVSVIALIIPVIAVVLGGLVRGEAPPPATYGGAALVLVGVATTLFTGRR
jgi:drug/metabolite transporter (DMT)-like permease